MSAPSPDTGDSAPDKAVEAADDTDVGTVAESATADTGGAADSVPAQPASLDAGQAASPTGEPPADAGDEPDSGVPVEVAAVMAERDAYLADLQRVTAEFTNFRRQTMKRNTDLVAQAASRLAKELLVVLDACEAAVGQGVEGIEALQSQLLGVLSAEGLTVLGTVDEPFDPGFHEAVMSEESTDGGAEAPTVAEVLRTGYTWNGRVLRPAMVKVRG